MTHSPNPLPPLDRIPAEIRCAGDYESLARRFIAAPAYAYIAGGSGNDVTATANRAAFDDWALCPRVLREVSAGHTRLQLGDAGFEHPVLLAPVALQRLVHPRGELETARAADATDSGFICSTLASQPLEDIATVAGPRRWFQLYFQPSREVTLELVRRAEAAGYRALVVTLDATIQMPSLSALRAGFRMPQDLVPVNLGEPPSAVATAPGASRILQGFMRSAPTWHDLDWLLGQTALPVWVKGVMHPDDALALRRRGCAGLVVSNHGGRTVDGVAASLRALPAVRAALGPDCPLLLDGGIRSGTDVFKALALGADAVLVGRLQVYALAVAGALGVAHLIRLLREELEVAMALTGCATLADVRRATLMPAVPATRPQERPC